MKLFEYIEGLDKAQQRIDETGLPRIKEIIKDFKNAEIYFHMDLDGVTSAIGLKQYLKNYGVKTVAAHKLQYGAQEFAAPKGNLENLHVMVDFAHGKPTMHIHTDHHDKQIGFDKSKQSTSFVKTPSNAEHISAVLSPSDIFPPKDLKIISTIDSADFSSQGLTPDDIMRAAFKLDPSIDVSKNHQMMGFVTNKLLLAYKNKPGFLAELVMNANPSLISMYNIIKKLAKDHGYKSPKEVEIAGKAYVSAQKEKIKQTDRITDIKGMKSGESYMIGNLVVQYGGGNMMKGGYDRYTPFKNHPNAHYLLIMWPMGLIQVSKNPFMKGNNPINLGDMVMSKIMPKFKNQLQKKEVSLYELKYMYEMDKSFTPESMGFTFEDLIATFTNKQIKGLDTEAIDGRPLTWKMLVKDLMSRQLKTLTKKQKNLLRNVSVTAWDVVVAGSGGHKDITNLTNLNFMGKGYVDFMKKIAMTIAYEMKDAELQ